MTSTRVVTLQPKTLRSRYSLHEMLDEAARKAEREGCRLLRPYRVLACELNGEWTITVAVVEESAPTEGAA